MFETSYGLDGYKVAKPMVDLLLGDVDLIDPLLERMW